MEHAQLAHLAYATQTVHVYICSSASSLILFFVFRPNERGERNDLRCGFGLAGERAGELIWWLLA